MRCVRQNFRRDLLGGHNFAGAGDDLDLHAVHQVGECAAHEDRNTVAGDNVEAIPHCTPLFGCDLRAPLKSGDTQDQQEEHNEQCEVHAGEHCGVPLGECGEHGATSGEQPHFVAIPVGSDGLQCCGAFLVVLGDERKEHCNTEVESLENQVADP